MRAPAPIDANPINAGATAGTAKDASTAASPPAQTTGNSGAAATLASGATTGTCENSDAASGAAARLEAAVSESASRARRGARWKHCAIHAWKSPANSTMPSVESADSANETASAVRGSSAMQPIMHTASALSAAGRRRAVNANMPANAMTAARTADEEAQQKRRLQHGSGAPGNAQRTQERSCAAGDDGQVRPRHRHEMREPAGLVGGVRVTYLEGAAPSAHERGEHRGPVVGPLVGDQVDRAIAKPCQDTEGVGTLAAHDSARRAFEHRALPPAVCRRRPARRGERRVGLQHVAVTRRVLAFLEPKPHRNGSDVGKVRAREARCAIRALRTVGCDFESPASRKAVALQLRLVLRGRAPACERDAERGSQQRGPRDRRRQPP